MVLISVQTFSNILKSCFQMLMSVLKTRSLVITHVRTRLVVMSVRVMMGTHPGTTARVQVQILSTYGQ